MEPVEAKLERMRLERDKALYELHNMKKVSSKTPNVRSKSEPNVTIDIINLKVPLEAAMKSDTMKVKQMETELVEKETLIDTMKKELNSFKEEVERRKDSEKKLYDSNDIQTGKLERANNMIENLRIQIFSLKDKMQGGVFEENRRLKADVDRLVYELRLQRDRTATDEVVMLRNELRRAMEAEENNKRAMDELALVISEVAMEANQAKEKLASAEEKIRIHNVAFSKTDIDEARKDNAMMRETIDRLRIEAEEALVVWDIKETEFVKCIKKEEDEKEGLKEENYILVELLTELEETSNKLREDTEKLKEAFKESFDEAEMAKAKSCELMDSLIENERRLAVFTQENERLREYEAASNDNIKEKEKEKKKKKLITSSSKELRKLTPSPPKEKSKSNGGEEEEQKRLTPSSSKKELKSLGEEKEQKKLVPSSSKKEPKSHVGEEKEYKWLLPSFSKKEKPPSIAEEKDQKKALIPSSSKKEHKSSSHCAEEKEHKKIRKESSLDKDSKPGNAHLKLMCFDPKAMLTIPGMSSSKHKEVGNSKEGDDDLTDSIFDLVESSHPHRNRKHRRTTSSLEDEKSTHSDEFEHKERPDLDDIEVERAGTNSTKKIVLLKRLGDLWKRKNQSRSHSHSHSHSNSHSPKHHDNQNQDIHQKEVTT